MFKCFTRTWWKENPSWPNGLEPGAGPKYSRARWVFDTEREAREFCQAWNAAHDPGRLSRKMEFESWGN